MREPSQSEHVRKPWKQLIDVHENLEREKTLRGRVLVVTAVRKGTSKNIKVFILFRFTEFEKMLPFYKNVTYLFSFTDRDKATNRLKCEYVWKCEVVVPWIYARVCGGTAWADSLNFSGYVFCFASHECEYIFGITITVLKISQNNDNRGRHLEFYFHTGIGNWFQCFPVYPGLNLSSGSGSVSGSGSGFRIPAFPYAPRKHSGFVIYSYFKDSSFYG